MSLGLLKCFLSEKIRIKAISALFTVSPIMDTMSDKYVAVQYILSDYMNQCTKRVVSLHVRHTGILAGWRKKA